MKTKLIYASLFVLVTNYANAQNVSYDSNGVPLLNGNNNVAIGLQILPSNTFGDGNTGVGYSSLFQNTVGGWNTGCGMNSLYSNTSGKYNTALGYNANVGSGILVNATAIGANAIVTSNNSIQLGDASVTQIFAGTGTNAKIFTGALQISGGTPGIGKVLISDASGNGSWQTLSLPSSGWSLSGDAGTVDGTNFIGTTDNVPFNFKVNNVNSGRIDNISGDTYFGYEAGLSAIVLPATSYPSSHNTAVGFRALKNSQGNSGGAPSSGYYNCAFGTNSQLNTLNGTNNCSFGSFSMLGNVNGGSNTSIGGGADVSSGSFYNATSIGASAIVNATNKVVIGSNTSGMVIGGYAPWSNLSDGRFKENVKENVPGIDFIKKLRPVTYVINVNKLDEHIMQNMPDSIKARHKQSSEAYAKALTKIQTGFIAQEVEKTAKELGYDFDGINAPKNLTDNYSIAYSQFVIPLVKAVQEQQQMIDELRSEINSLKNAKEANNHSTSLNQLFNPENYGVSLEQNIPNPFTQETSINYTLPQSVVTAYISVFDLTGKLIKSIPLNQRGKATLVINSEKLESGMYYYSIIADDKVIDSKKMIVSGK